jgi:uncharacterized protein YxeA
MDKIDTDDKEKTNDLKKIGLKSKINKKVILYLLLIVIVVIASSITYDYLGTKSVDGLDGFRVSNNYNITHEFDYINITNPKNSHSLCVKDDDDFNAYHDEMSSKVVDFNAKKDSVNASAFKANIGNITNVNGIERFSENDGGWFSYTYTIYNIGNKIARMHLGDGYPKIEYKLFYNLLIIN